MSDKHYTEVQIPKELAEEIEKSPMFKQYRDVDEFVAEAVRVQLMKLLQQDEE